MQNTPFFLVFGRDARLPHGEVLLHEKPLYSGNYATYMANNLFQAFRAAKEASQVAHERERVKWSVSVNDPAVAVGSIVYVRSLAASKTDQKLGPRYTGPYRVIRLIGSYGVELRPIGGKPVVREVALKFVKPVKAMVRGFEKHWLDDTIPGRDTVADYLTEAAAVVPAEPQQDAADQEGAEAGVADGEEVEEPDGPLQEAAGGDDELLASGPVKEDVAAELKQCASSTPRKSLMQLPRRQKHSPRDSNLMQPMKLETADPDEVGDNANVERAKEPLRRAAAAATAQQFAGAAAETGIIGQQSKQLKHPQRLDQNLVTKCRDLKFEHLSSQDLRRKIARTNVHRGNRADSTQAEIEVAETEGEIETEEEHGQRAVEVGGSLPGSGRRAGSEAGESRQARLQPGRSAPALPRSSKRDAESKSCGGASSTDAGGGRALRSKGGEDLVHDPLHAWQGYGSEEQQSDVSAVFHSAIAPDEVFQ